MGSTRVGLRWGARAGVAALMGAVAACGTILLNETGSLTRYDRLQATAGLTTAARVYADPAALATARTVRIVPTAFPADAPGAADLTPAERALVANAADRALCYDLSLRYSVVAGEADLTVRARVTRVEATGLPGTGATLAAGNGLTLAAHLGIGLARGFGRFPVPRLPIGLGSLTVEGEALDRRREQRAAMVWSGGANALLSQVRLSRASDAYDLAGDFGQDLGYLVATGQDPLSAPNTLPTWERVRVLALGEAPRPGCAAFGRAPGIDALIADRIGLPPDLADRDTRTTPAAPR